MRNQHDNKHPESRQLGGRTRLAAGALLSLFILGVAGTARGAEDLVPFDGEKSSWHGFDRYDFLMDETDLTIKPYKVAPDEKNAIKAQVKGQRRCVVVVPKTAAPGNPWSWQGCYWDHEPQTEVELLKRGFHIAFAAPDAGKQGKVWDAWYKFLTEKHGLAKKAAFVGMSKGGVNEFNWGVVNPDKVACIYADNTALYEEDFAKLGALAKHDVPLLHVCGTEDMLLQRHTRVVEDTYHQLGGLITVIVKEGHAHHPHSLQNPKPIADWIEQHMTPSTANRPAFVDEKFAKGYYYSLEPSFIYLKEEDTYATARGPGFTECYDRFDAPTSGTFRTGGMSIIVPKTVAVGKPWVFTGDPIERDATVEQALLAKGYHIVVLPPTGSGMTQKQWDDAYKLLVDNGFSTKPVLKGTGAMAGEAYAWAVANPGKVSCIYARNPLMKSLMAGKEQPIDNLAALAKAGVPALHDCGALDPWLDKQTRVVEKRYKAIDGKITVIVREGEGHFPLSPKDPKSVVDFIVGPKSAPSDKAGPQQDPPQQGRASNEDTKAAESAKPTFDKNSPFYFDESISRQALENYLDRAITMGFFLVPGEPQGYKFPYRDDDVRMIHNLGAKFIGRAIYRWGEESKLGDPAFLEYAKKMVDRVHAADPEIVFQGCLFERVSTDVNKLKIPAWVFKDFDLPVEDRTFSCAAIIKREGRPDRGTGRGGVPIINNLETRLWFYYLAVSYINVGCEAFHLGQVGLIGAEDKDLRVYSEFLAKVRTYAKRHARRHLVLLDGHVPSGGMIKDGVSLLDFNSFPLRIEAVPNKPQEAILEVGHLDALFKRSKGCTSPSGWKCDSLPYLVEFDNFGRGPNPNVADPKSMFCWGWDEISWFAQQPEEYRNQWLLYAHDWIKKTDFNGHLEMPGTRMISCPNETLRTYFANTKNPTCPVGYSQEETIKKIWNDDAALAGTKHGAGQYATVEYPASTAENELQVGVTYTLWIPDGVKTLRGIIVHQHGAGTTASKEGATAAYDLHWQALAKKWDCALLGPSYHVLNEKTDITPGGSELWFDPRRGSEKAFLKALDDLAAKSEHPELKTVPWALWGHSGGGIWSDVMTTLHPDRVVAVWMRSGTALMFLTHPEFTRPKLSDALAAIPMMCNPGVKEKPMGPEKPDAEDKRTVEEKMKGPWLGSLATFKEYRAKGVPIGMAPDPRTGHECGDSRYLAIPFLDACLAMRLPDKGAKDQTLKPVDLSKAWLAPVLGDTAQPATEFKGNAKEAVWLPNEAVAKAWMEYVKTGAVGDTTPPPAPTNVRVASKGDKGVEITWDAEADFESGIRGFIVLRDGQELAQVPPKPVGKFGRPLFQSMTYHDTPSKPLPEMRYVDASAKPEDKHTYAVITVNSVELKSEPSAKATLQK